MADRPAPVRGGRGPARPLGAGRQPCQRHQPVHPQHRACTVYLGPECLYRPATVPDQDEFGRRRILNGQPRSPHTGVDLGAPDGTPVHAMQRGRVVLDEDLFPKGEVRCVIQGYQLTRHGLSAGGKFTIVVSKAEPVTSADAAQAISNEMTITWPMERRITRFRPHSRHQPPEPLDAFPIPGEEEANPPTKPKPAAPPAKPGKAKESRPT